MRVTSMISLKWSHFPSIRAFFGVLSIQFLVTILPECEAQGDSCGSRSQRSARLMKVASCDLTVNDYCSEAGPEYPWRDMMKFVIENRAIMTRMYGEVKESSVIEDEISLKTGRSMNIGRKVSKGKEYIQYSDTKTPEKKKSKHTISYSSNKKPTTPLKQSSISISTQVTPGEEVNETSTETPFATVTEILDEESESSDEIITIFKKDSYFISEQQLEDRKEQIDLKDLYYDTMKTITVMKETTSPVTTPTPSTTTEQLQASSTTTTTVESATTQPIKSSKKSTTTMDPSTTTTQYYSSEDYYYGDLGPDSEETWEINYEPMSACQATVEYFTPYWANNTRGETLALINIHPYEQYVHSEKCVNLNKQDNCKEGCKCEQQYRLYRLLAYDPSNNCRGIFADWFRLPGCCTCMCYNIPPTLPPTMSPDDFLFIDTMSSRRQGRKSMKPIPLRYRNDQ